MSAYFFVVLSALLWAEALVILRDTDNHKELVPE